LITDWAAFEPRGKYGNLRHKFGLGDNELVGERSVILDLVVPAN
jgi:hypothetical protein